MVIWGTVCWDRKNSICSCLHGWYWSLLGVAWTPLRCPTVSLLLHSTGSLIPSCQPRVQRKLSLTSDPKHLRGFWAGEQSDGLGLRSTLSACLPSKGTLNYPGVFVTQCILETVAVVSSYWPYFGEKIFSLSQVLMSKISDRNSSQQMLPNLGIQKATLGQATLLRGRQGWGQTFILLPVSETSTLLLTLAWERTSTTQLLPGSPLHCSELCSPFLWPPATCPASTVFPPEAQVDTKYSFSAHSSPVIMRCSQSQG